MRLSPLARLSVLKLAAILMLAAALSAEARDAKKKEEPAQWPGTELPLPLAVRTKDDLAFKALTEKQYLVFNLLAGGKLAYDRGDFAQAAEKWERLLQLDGLDAKIDEVVRPLATEARAKAGGEAAQLPPPREVAEGETKAEEKSEEKAAAPAEEKPAARPRRRGVVSVEAVVSGGGPAGPGGAVVTLKRVGGRMPRLAVATDKVVNQRAKQFVPRVLAVPVGTSVVFRNEDPLAHNVFSLSPAKKFDTGLYKSPGEAAVAFDKPGVIQLLCNIHSSMVGYVVVVDTPYYAQADGKGAFTIRGVIPGDYDLEIWHENASAPTRLKVAVGRDGSLTRDGNPIELSVGGDQQAPAFPLDKYGKPRQTQLGY
jgi:plastocyanin